MNSSRTPTAKYERFNWQYFVARSGVAGEQWTAEFTRGEFRLLVDLADTALARSHRRDYQSALDMLDSMSARMDALDGVRVSIIMVLRRLYHGVLAYCHYGRERFDEAADQLEEAGRCVRLAVDADRVLLPFVHDCHEFQLHHARIARNQRRWDAMREHIERTRGMVENRRPLCVLSDGTNVDYTTLEHYYKTLLLDDEERRGLLPLVDIDLRRDYFSRFLMRLYLLPGVVIPY